MNNIFSNNGRSRKRVSGLSGERTVEKKVYFPETLAAELEKAAKNQGVSLSKYINDLIKQTFNTEHTSSEYNNDGTEP